MKIIDIDELLLDEKPPEPKFELGMIVKLKDRNSRYYNVSMLILKDQGNGKILIFNLETKTIYAERRSLDDVPSEDFIIVGKLK